MAAHFSAVFASSSRAVSRLVMLGVIPLIAVLVGLAWFVAAPLAADCNDRGGRCSSALP